MNVIKMAINDSIDKLIKVAIDPKLDYSTLLDVGKKLSDARLTLSLIDSSFYREEIVLLNNALRQNEQLVDQKNLELMLSINTNFRAIGRAFAERMIKCSAPYEQTDQTSEPLAAKIYQGLKHLTIGAYKAIVE